uniref:Ion transport domain-containing protein n=1 Tax=Plectus sambesii TaxID=2011161 RepID=A0A914XW21_9BILA
MFWGIDGNEVEPCCWKTYTVHRETEDVLSTLDKLDAVEEINTECNYQRFGWEEDFRYNRLTFWQRIKPQMWAIMDHPNSSPTARIVAGISVFFLVTATAAFCLETVPTLALENVQNLAVFDDDGGNSTLVELTQRVDASLYEQLLLHSRRAVLAWQIVCNIWFVLEIIFRFVSCPSKPAFLVSPLTLIDVIATMTFFANLIISSLGGNIRALHILGMIRVMRLFKLTQHTNGLKVLWQTFKASAKEFVLLVFFLLLGVIFFATMIYYAEQSDDNTGNHFQSIPQSMWWAIVTMTTVGYGDMYPQTVSGRLVGSMCAVAGVLTIALPVPVIVNNFATFYTHTQARAKMPKNKRTMVHIAKNDVADSPMKAVLALNGIQWSSEKSINELIQKTSKKNNRVSRDRERKGSFSSILSGPGSNASVPVTHSSPPPSRDERVSSERQMLMPIVTITDTDELEKISTNKNI